MRNKGNWTDDLVRSVHFMMRIGLLAMLLVPILVVIIIILAAR